MNPNIRNIPDSLSARADALSNAMNATTDVALILWNPDVIDLVSFVLLRRNVRSCGIEPSEGTERISDFIRSCSPAVVVFDLDPPYARSAADALYLLHRFPDHQFVMTCADRTLALSSASWLSCHPLFEKPYQLDDIAHTVHSMVIRGASKLSALPLAR
jgi:hypothetical protein